MILYMYIFLSDSHELMNMLYNHVCGNVSFIIKGEKTVSFSKDT